MCVFFSEFEPFNGTETEAHGTQLDRRRTSNRAYQYFGRFTGVLGRLPLGGTLKLRETGDAFVVATIAIEWRHHKDGCCVGSFGCSS